MYAPICSYGDPIMPAHGNPMEPKLNFLTYFQTFDHASHLGSASGSAEHFGGGTAQIRTHWRRMSAENSGGGGYPPGIMAVPPDLSICAPRNAPNRHRHQQDLKSHFSWLKLSIIESGIWIIFMPDFRSLDLNLAIKMLGGEGGIRVMALLYWF